MCTELPGGWRPEGIRAGYVTNVYKYLQIFVGRYLNIIDIWVSICYTKSQIGSTLEKVSKMNPIISELEKEYTQKEMPETNPGDTVKVFVRIIEGNKERTQAFEGTVIKKHGSGINKTITVRKIFQGVGVERVFAIYSPRIEKIQVLRKGDVRRSKLYYLRERSGKATRIREKLEKR